MKKLVAAAIVMVSYALLVSGCANKEAVKKDETVSAPAQPAEKSVQKAVSESVAQKQASVQPKQVETPKVEVQQAAPSPVAAEPVKAEEEFKGELEKIYFAFDSDALSDQSRDTLYKNAETIIKKTKGKLFIEGHCDERGSDEYNLALGEKRAKAALKYLQTLGVAPERISIISYGEERPADSGHTEEAWAKNRRAEFKPAK